jgi:transcriptional regulator with XRE-family HTH domain
MEQGEPMLIGTRLRQLRKQKGMCQGDIEERTGLPSCSVSRIENGHTLPSLQTLERFAEVLGVPLYQLFYCGDEAPPPPSLTPRETLEVLTADNYGEGPDAKFLLKLSSLLSQLTERDRDVFLGLAKELAAR